MAVGSMHFGVWSWSRQSPELQTNVRMGRQDDLSNFVHGMVVGARRAGLFHNLLSYWDFHAQPFLGL